MLLLRPCASVKQLSKIFTLFVYFTCLKNSKKFFVLGWLEQPSNKNLLYRHDEPYEPTKRKDPFQLYSISPHLPPFQQWAGATPLWSLWWATGWIFRIVTWYITAGECLPWSEEKGVSRLGLLKYNPCRPSRQFPAVCTVTNVESHTVNSAEQIWMLFF